MHDRTIATNSSAASTSCPAASTPAQQRVASDQLQEQQQFRFHNIFDRVHKPTATTTTTAAASSSLKQSPSFASSSRSSSPCRSDSLHQHPVINPSYAGVHSTVSPFSSSNPNHHPCSPLRHPSSLHVAHGPPGFLSSSIPEDRPFLSSGIPSAGDCVHPFSDVFPSTDPQSSVSSPHAPSVPPSTVSAPAVNYRTALRQRSAMAAETTRMLDASNRVTGKGSNAASSLGPAVVNCVPIESLPPTLSVSTAPSSTTQSAVLPSTTSVPPSSFTTPFAQPYTSGFGPSYTLGFGTPGPPYTYGGFPHYGYGIVGSPPSAYYDDNASFFTQSVETLSRFSQLLDMNSWFFDQLCDVVNGMRLRIDAIRSSVVFLPQRLCDQLLALRSPVRGMGMFLLESVHRMDLLAPPDDLDLATPAQSQSAATAATTVSEASNTTTTITTALMDSHQPSSWHGLPPPVWVDHYKDAVKRLRLSITLCVAFLLVGLWRLFRLWRRSRRRSRTRMLSWDILFGPSNRPSTYLKNKQTAAL